MESYFYVLIEKPRINKAIVVVVDIVVIQVVVCCCCSVLPFYPRGETAWVIRLGNR